MPAKSKRTGSEAIQPTVAREIRKKLFHWGRINYQNYPWRKPEKLWHGLIAEILLQRTRAISVIPVFEKFVDRFPNIQDICNASVEEIEHVIFPLGLKWRAPLIKKLGEQLFGLGGEIPRDFNELIKLAGVGQYVASAWLSFHGKKRGILIDTNTVRFFCRILDRKMDGETRREKWVAIMADRLTPIRGGRSFNYALLDFSMLICSNNSPKCNLCPIRYEYCLYSKKRLRKGYP